MKIVNRGSVLRRGVAALFTAVLASASVAPSMAYAQTPPPALAPGAAGSAGEAPGSAPLAGEPAANPNDPSAQRGMSFSAGGGPVCRDTVPGGTLLVVAYAITIALMGIYVAFLAWKNAQLAKAMDALEAQIAKRAAAVEKKSEKKSES